MRIIFCDFETYYDDNYTLKRLTPVEYILDHRFAPHGAAIAEGDEHPLWMDNYALQLFFRGVDWSQTAFASHNALFDACILAWYYGHDPALIIDTMGMSRALLYHKTGSVSLDTISQYLGFGKKWGTVAKTKGLTIEAIKAIPGLYRELQEYAIDDLEKCRGIFKKLSEEFPDQEFLVNHIVCKMATRPQFVLDPNILAEHYHEVRENKQALLSRIGIVTRDDLMSNDRFAQALRSVGVMPPTKTSRITGKLTYAFAKSDEEFTDLENHWDPRVQALVAARMGVKSTIEETRSKRFLDISQLEWGAYGQGRGLGRMMPVPLRYGGAHTHRLSGDWKLNEQNLTRGGNLRKAHKAPDGHTVISCDESQIEARLVAWLAGEQSLVAEFATGTDVYSGFASEVYGYEVRKTSHPAERFVGKQAILGLGFGMAAPRFETQIKADSYKQGVNVTVSYEFCERVVQIYRLKYPRIPQLWRRTENLLVDILRGNCVQLGPVHTEFGAIVLPSGLKIHYTDLELKQDSEYGQQWWYRYGKMKKKLFGGKVTENIIQALARIIVMDAACRIHKRLPWLDLAHQVHDELIYVPPVETFEEVSGVVREEMSKAPWWAPDLPVVAELNYGASYGDCK